MQCILIKIDVFSPQMQVYDVFTINHVSGSCQELKKIFYYKNLTTEKLIAYNHAHSIKHIFLFIFYIFSVMVFKIRTDTPQE
jgi:hypothetical protein